MVGGSEITGSSTVFVGESITSGQLPTQLNLPDGSRYRIGIGSRVQLRENLLVLDGGSLEIMATGSKPPVLQVAGLEFALPNDDTRASLYISRPDIVSVSVDEGSIVSSRPNGKQVQAIKAGEMVTFANTRSEIKIDKQNAAADIAEVQAEQLRHLGKLGRLNPTLGGKALALLGTLAAASGGLISARMGGPDASPGAVTGAKSMPTLAASSYSGPETGFAAVSSVEPSSSFDTRAMRRATRNAQQVLRTGLWGVTGCGAGCRWGVPIVTTHIFFFPVVGGTVRPFCIVRSCLEPSPFRP